MRIKAVCDRLAFRTKRTRRAAIAAIPGLAVLAIASLASARIVLAKGILGVKLSDKTSTVA